MTATPREITVKIKVDTSELDAFVARLTDGTSGPKHPRSTHSHGPDARYGLDCPEVYLAGREGRVIVGLCVVREALEAYWGESL